MCGGGGCFILFNSIGERRSKLSHSETSFSIVVIERAKEMQLRKVKCDALYILAKRGWKKMGDLTNVGKH